jgi:hypothetical protein
MNKKTRWFLLISLTLLVAAGLASWAHLAAASDTAPLRLAAAGGGTAVMPDTTESPIVSVVVGNTVTDYEMDPFTPTLLKKATNRVKTLLVIRADGTVETKQVQ